jgi:hypothetical protein
VTVGLPGAGIGGLFYLLAALATPLCEVARALRKSHTPRRWTRALRHFVLAASIVFGMWLAAWWVGALVISSEATRTVTAAGIRIDSAYAQAVGRNVALFTATTLAAVLTAVEIGRLLIPRRRGPARPLDIRGQHSLHQIGRAHDVV